MTRVEEGAHPHHGVHLAVTQLVEDVHQLGVREARENILDTKYPALGR